ncbi:structure-specific endonuclease subunit SLX1 [Sesamum indicum]|uniref:Structure-specific endonuclease subunit SLX1 homolog n=1 Tax=Sesamum indicum TaxID=4182 RepID=A0A6I9TD82_SESIN|nr:structure-specific endonuclease subunit SLX1 [Sesamum indicum]
MGKRKERGVTQETPISNHERCENGEEEEGGGGKGAGFFACYLLTSLCPRFKGHTYIGYTVNPRRRIRQHNGEIGSGAWRTKRKRPWEMVLCIYGFPTNIAALQFEWAWQHPVESLAVRTAAANFKSLGGLANKIKLAYTMLTLPAWQGLNLTVNLFSTKYQKYTSCCPSLPEQMRTQVCSMDELPCYNLNVYVNDDDEEEECNMTSNLLEPLGNNLRSRSNIHDSPSSRLSTEENVLQLINDRDNATSETIGCLAKTWVGWPQNSHSIREEEEDEGPSFIINTTPGGTSCSLASPYIVEDVQSPRLTKELVTSELDNPLTRRSAIALVADKPLIWSPGDITHKVEIIEIFTPSPCCRVNSGSKKRRPSLCPEIIDLTNSPMFV